MGINTIRLPAAIVEELYHSSLILNPTEAVKKKKAPGGITMETGNSNKETDAPKWKWLGNNDRNILILVQSAAAVHLPDHELSFLTGILSACKLSLADVAIINKSNYPGDDYKEMTRFFASRIVLLFDTEPSSFGLPLSFPHYQIQPFASTTFLYTPSLKDLENDKIEKSKLWVCLKRLFNL